MSVTETIAMRPQVRQTAFRRVARNPSAIIASVILLIAFVIAAVGPLLAGDANRAVPTDILLPPGGDHLLGTDGSGRDIANRLLLAVRASLAGTFLAVGVAMAVGVPLGLIAGYFRGKAEIVASFISNLIQSIPGVIILVAAASVIGRSLWGLMAVFGIVLSPIFFRVTYAAVRGVRSELYIDAATVAGLSPLAIIGRHILSVVRGPIIVQTATVAAIALGIQSGLQFLGLGDDSVTTLGSMLKAGFDAIFTAWWPLLWPALVVALLCVSFTLLANAIRDALEGVETAAPRTRKRPASRVPSSTSPSPESSETATRSQVEVPFLRIEDLVVEYQRPDGSTVDVVRGLSLEVASGQIHGLVGESGSGKTQTAFAALGLLGQGGRIARGTVSVAGEVVTPERVASVRGRQVGYIPQEPMSNLDPSFTVGYQLCEALRVVDGKTRRQAEEEILELLRRVGIRDPRRTFRAHPHELSGGMAQRALIAGAVARRPQLLIADEPTTALDVTVQAEVLDLIRELRGEFGMGVLLVTHNFGVVADVCDVVSVIHEGRIVESGNVEDLFAAPSHPYTRSLLSAVIDDAGPVRERVMK